MNKSKSKFKFEKICVVMGGVSGERDVSLASGEAVYQSLLKFNQYNNIFKYDLKSLDLSDFLHFIQNNQITKVFIALHGGAGENGELQKTLDQHNIKYTGSNAQSSNIAMDKYRSKQIWKSNNLMVSEGLKLDAQTPIIIQNILNQFDLPLAIKPNSEGSSLGVNYVDNIDQIELAIKNASQYGDVIIEPWITGREIAVGIIHNQALPSVWIRPEHNFYDYYSKYQSDKTQYILNSLAPELEQSIQSSALRAFKTLGCSGWGRVDFILTENNTPYLLEANTVPGLTEHSLVPKAAKEVGIDFDVLVKKILEN